MGVEPKIGVVKPPKSSICLIGFYMKKTIHFGVFPPIFGNTHMLLACVMMCSLSWWWFNAPKKGPLCHQKTTLCRIFDSSFVICMPPRVLDLNSVFSTVGHGCLSTGTNFMTFTNQSMDHLINIETAFAGRLCQADTVVGIFSVLAPQGLWLILWQLRVQWWWLISLQVLPAALFSLSNQRLNR